MPENRSGDVQTRERLLDSSLESVDAAEEAAMKAGSEAGLSEDDLHALGMAVREAVVNAVVHGNRYSARKKVHFRVTKAPGRLTVVIGDEGEGFNFGEVPDPLAQENLLRQSGRGLLLMRAFVDEFEIRRREPNGMEVLLVKAVSS